jgi:rare lipoprotein A
MYVPATQAQPASATPPAGILSAGPSLAAPPFERPSGTAVRVSRVSLNVLDGHPAMVRGTLLRSEPRAVGLARRLVTLELLGRHGWHAVARAHTGSEGRFRLRYVPTRIGTEAVRLRFAGDVHDLPARRRLGRLNVFRVTEASWYGGGGGMACGGSLTSATMGVANKSLPCGSLVTLRYHGRTVRVPVVDRGPYVSGRDFDLTEATKQALGFGDTGQVWSTC